MYDECDASLINHNLALPCACPATPPLITTSQVPPALSPPLIYNLAVGITNPAAGLSSISLVVDAPIPTLPLL